MRAYFLITGLTAIFATGCVSQAREAMQSSTSGAVLVRTGYVSEVRDIAIHDHSRTSAAPTVGALVGGIAGSMVGSGGGRVIGAIGGAAGGSLAAQGLAQPEKSSFRKVTVRFEDRTSETYEVSSEAAFRVGDPVKLVNRNGTIQLTR